MITGEIVDENTSVTKDIIILDGIKNISRYYIRAKELKIEEVKQIISVNKSPTEAKLLTEFDAHVLLKNSYMLMAEIGSVKYSMRKLLI